MNAAPVTVHEFAHACLQCSHRVRWSGLLVDRPACEACGAPPDPEWRAWAEAEDRRRNGRREIRESRPRGRFYEQEHDDDDHRP